MAILVKAYAGLIGNKNFKKIQICFYNGKIKIADQPKDYNFIIKNFFRSCLTNDLLVGLRLSPALVRESVSKFAGSLLVKEAVLC